MRKWSLYLLLLCWTQILVAQVEFDKVKYDFGDLEPYSDRFVDFKLHNAGTKKEWLLSLKKPGEVIYIQSKQFIEPDSTILIRLQINPRQKGRFAYDVDVFTSDRSDPVRIKLTGNLLELPADGSAQFTACPSFEERAGGINPNSFELTVVTIDKVTREAVSGTQVNFIQNGAAVWTKKTDKRGEIKDRESLGYSYFYAKKESYKPAELGAYINFKRNYILIELEKDPLYCPPVPVDVGLDTLVVAEEITIEIEEELKNETPIAFMEEVPPSFSDLSEDNFDSRYFKPINVTFVLDVSSSMQQADKIELMKYALFQIVEMIRPEDRFSIVTYASDAQVLLPSTPGSEKDKIKEEVSALKAFGFTAGGSGIKLGFKTATKSKLEDGINQVIVITDGAFNRNSADYKKYVTKYAKKGISMSVVGIKNKDVDELEMREAASLGRGHFIPIQKLADAAYNLKHSLRVQAYRH